MLVPITPPPMITTRARDGSSVGTGDLLQEPLEPVEVNPRAAFSKRSSPHASKSKSRVLAEAWIAPHNDHPYADTRACSRTRASRFLATRPSYAATSASTWSSSRSHSVAVLPSSKQASLLPEYS